MTLAQYNQTPFVEHTNIEPVTPPPMTALMEQVLAKSTGFQHLVSYTDHGFEPPVLDIKKGDVVRFTNNASRDLWIASAVAESGRLYPSGTQESCGQSAFDSCVSMKLYEFWEFRFDAVGDWSYVNNAMPTDAAAIHVQ